MPQMCSYNNSIECGFKKYTELISCLLVDGKNNELLMRNHQSCPTGSEPFLEVNVISSQTRGHGRERGRGRNFQYHGTHGSNHSNSQKRKTSWNHQKWNNTKVKQENGKYIQNTPSKAHENNCHRCGMKGHWSCTCCTPKHLANLYQASIKEKGKEIEMNYTDINGLDLTYYDTDFFRGLSGKTDYLMNDENTVTE